MQTFNGNQNIWQEFIAENDEVHKEAETSARRKETEKLLESTDWLRRAAELAKRYQGLMAQAEQLVLERREPRSANDRGQPRLEPETAPSSSEEIVESGTVGGKVRADECRDTYVAREKRRGNTLNRLRRGYYQNRDGSTVGITYSSHKKDKKDTWFLNLQEGQFQEAVLLCEASSDSVHVIHLPMTFMTRYGRQMSRDGKGQVKFNVSRRNGRFLLQVPEPVGWLEIMEYVESDPLVCQPIRYA
jgi:hypothetical protein